MAQSIIEPHYLSCYIEFESHTARRRVFCARLLSVLKFIDDAYIYDVKSFQMASCICCHVQGYIIYLLKY